MVVAQRATATLGRLAYGGGSLRYRIVAPVGVLSAAVAVLVVVAIQDPNEAGNYPTSPFLWATGYYCPGCGTLRSLHSLTHLDVGGALRLNLFAVCFGLPFLAYRYSRWTAERVADRQLWRDRRVHPGWLWGLLCGILAFWLLRNLPPLSVLAPNNVPPDPRFW